MRLQALERSKDHHKPLIVDGAKAKSHIVFESEDKMEDDTSEVIEHEQPKHKENTLLSLFGSDSEYDSDVSVKVTKPQFEGKQGGKLFKLQQKIGWDKRFEVDERFLNDTDSSDEFTSAEQDDNELVSSGDEELRREQQRNLDLIEEMFGNTSSVITPETQTMPEVQRYDPSTTGSELLEKQPPPAKKKKDGLKEDGKATSSTAQLQEVHKPEVSKERFYNISNSLKDVLQNTEGSHTFNFTTSTPKVNHSTSETAVTSKKAPSWLLNLHDDGNDETSASDETSITELPTDGQKRMLFFFHANSSELRNRLDCPDTKFHRTCSLEELETTWPHTRARLKEQYKRRHRDALRWLRQRKQIK